LNKAGLSEPSDVSPVFTTLKAPPADPAAPQLGTVTDTSAAFAWTLPNSFGIPTLFSIISVAESPCLGDYLTVYRGTTLAYTVQGLKSGTSYCVRLQVANSNGLSKTSMTKITTNASKPPKPNPPRPSLSEDITDFQIPLVWESSSEVRPPVQGFDLEMRAVFESKSSTFEVIYSGKNNNFVAKNLMPDQLYEFQLKVLNSIGASEYSSPVAFSTLKLGNNPSTCPDTPSGISTLEATNSSLLLTWSKSDVKDIVYVVQRTDGVPTNIATDGSSVFGLPEPPLATDLRYDRRGAGNKGVFIEVYRGPDTHVLVSGLNPGRSYGIRVQALSNSKALVIAPSQSLRFDTKPTVPATPDSPILVQTSAKQMRVQWNAPVDSGSVVKSYILSLSQNSTEQLVAIDGGGVTNYTFTTLQPASLYRQACIHF
jgi:hypothetical protein